MAAVTESRYKSLKFWQRAKAPLEPQAIEEKIPEATLQTKRILIPLVESHEAEVYKLSTVDSGLYIPPSPTLTGKRDHWIDVEEVEFSLPGKECLTSRLTEKHDFFTPSSFVETQPYVLPHLVSSFSLSSDTSMEDIDLL
ncbi:hypothetical protein BY458DRAFT_497813 [Sporodiniella umbellata]|nr:hypothetical protein BY458DRAFT_497813 [Sporodiniella umbellata]